MKLICPYSGISYTTIGYGHGRAPHPIFYIPIKTLVQQQLEPFMIGKLDRIETHLLGCALLQKLPILWQCTIYIDNWEPVWPTFIDKLAAIALSYDPRKLEQLPQFRLDNYNSDPKAVTFYVKQLNEVSLGIGASATRYDNGESIGALRLLRNAINNVDSGAKLPIIMSNWAATVGHFPNTTFPISGSTASCMKLSEYWKHIIRLAFSSISPMDILNREDGIRIEAADIEELLEHCEQYIEYGSLHSIVLFKKLRHANLIVSELRSGIATPHPTPQDKYGISDNISDTSTAMSGPKLSDYRNIKEFLAAKRAIALREAQQGNLI